MRVSGAGLPANPLGSRGGNSGGPSPPGAFTRADRPGIGYRRRLRHLPSAGRAGRSIFHHRSAGGRRAFPPAQHPPEALGHKALARGLSDIAAMGGVPRFCLLSLAAGARADRGWVDRFYDGLLRLARLAGDTAGGRRSGARGPKRPAISWSVAPSRGAPRCGAMAPAPGDAIYVSGRLGGSALGLEEGTGKAWASHLRPQPRLALGMSSCGRASAPPRPWI